MTPRELILAAARRMTDAGVPDAAHDAAALLSHLTGRPVLALRTDFDSQVDEATAAQFCGLTDRRCRREPLQYLTGEAYFLGRFFHVDDRVLIPRPETEHLAELGVERLRGLDSPVALDLCCGSGCLAVSLKLGCPAAQVHAADLSPEALAVTQMNARRLGAEIHLHQGDLLDAVDEDLAFDLIVTNPPYIPTAECEVLQAEVTREPMLALDGGADGLLLYRRIAAGVSAHLKPGGLLAAEIGIGEEEAVSSLWRQAGLTNIRILPDFRGIPRIVTGQKPVCKEGIE